MSFHLKDFSSTFCVGIYGAEVHIIVCENPKEKNNSIESLSDFENECSALSNSDGLGNFYIFLPNNFDYDIIAHEIFHITIMIMDWIGATFSTDNHEPWAYLHGYLVQNIIDILDIERV